jgi:hypothetical protein
MKNLVVYAALGFLGTGAFANSLNVSAKNEGNSFAIQFKTVANHKSMCHLTVYDLHVTLPAFGLQTMSAEGVINLQVKRDPSKMCLTAIGPHRGAILFARGNYLPNLPNQKYRLNINNEDYGTIVVGEDRVSLQE